MSKAVSIPPYFICPISQRLMEDPVMWVDGNTYERREIEGWLAKHKFNTTSSDLAYRNILFPNRAARSGIAAFLAKNADRMGEGKRRIEQEDPGEIPEHFVCSLSQRIMCNPVTCADGVTYERSEIERWLVLCNKSPTTNELLRNKTLTPNDRLKAEIDAFGWQHYVRKIHLIYFQVMISSSCFLFASLARPECVAWMFFSDLRGGPRWIDRHSRRAPDQHCGRHQANASETRRGPGGAPGADVWRQGG